MRQFVPLLLVVLAASCDPLTRENPTVKQGNEALDAGESSAAIEAYQTAQAELPESAELHYDLGSALLKAGQLDEAATALARSLDTAREPLRSKVMANLGLTRLQQALAEEDLAVRKDLLEKSVSHLEAAVLGDPTMEEPRKNLEVALWNLYPPCSLRDDVMEPNDSLTAAKPLEEALGKELRVCPGGSDFFRQPLKQGDRWLVTLSPLDSEGGTLPRVAVLGDDGAIKDYPEKSGGGKIALRFVARADGDYFLRMDEEDGLEHSYKMESKVVPPCQSFPDDFEPNNRLDQAAMPQGEKMSLRLCPGDEEWFAIQLPAHAGIFATMTSDDLTGTVKMDIVDVESRVLAESQAGTPGGGAGDGGPSSHVAALLDVPDPGTYYVHVYGDTPEAEAGLELSVQGHKPCPEGDDDAEPNDAMDKPYALYPPPQGEPAPGAGQGGSGAPSEGQPFSRVLRRCPGNDDWYRIDVKKDHPLEVSAAFEHLKGDLKMELYKQGDYAPLASSDNSALDVPGEGVNLPATEDQSYLIRITGEPETSNFYEMRIAPPKDQEGKEGDESQKQDQDQKQNEDQKKDQDQKQNGDQKQTSPEPEKKNKPDSEALEKMMDQLDKEHNDNLEAQKAVRGVGSGVREPRRRW